MMVIAFVQTMVSFQRKFSTRFSTLLLLFANICRLILFVFLFASILGVPKQPSVKSIILKFMTEALEF